MATITCPSGLIGEIRGLKTKEANLLADKAALRQGKGLDGILKGCWVSTTDPGPYKEPLDWQNVLICDRFYTLLRIRAASFGEKYVFKVKCPDCEETFDWQLLLNKLPVKPLPEASRTAIAQGQNRFETTLLNGKKIWYKLHTGASEVQSHTISRSQRNKLLSANTAARVLEIEGVDPQEKTKFIEEMDFAELLTLTELFDEAEGGVETDIETECTHCFSQVEVSLPLGKSFFLPKGEKKEATTVDL